MYFPHRSTAALALAILLVGAQDAMPAKPGGVDHSHEAQITEPPVSPERHQFQQRDRFGTSFTVTIAPDGACGYIDGNRESARGCDNGRTCMWDTGYHLLMCGRVSDQPLLFSLGCYDLDQVSNAPENNTHFLRCHTNNPYCFSYLYDNGITEYGCTITQSGVTSVLSTYSGHRRHLTTMTISSTALIFNTSHMQGGFVVAPVLVLPDNKRNIGAIAGGVIGGVVLIALLVLGTFWSIRRRRSKAAGDKPPSSSRNQPSSAVEVNLKSMSPTTDSPISHSLQELPGSAMFSVASEVQQANSPQEIYSTPIYEASS